MGNENVSHGDIFKAVGEIKGRLDTYILLSEDRIKKTEETQDADGKRISALENFKSWAIGGGMMFILLVGAAWTITH